MVNMKNIGNKIVKNANSLMKSSLNTNSLMKNSLIKNSLNKTSLMKTSLMKTSLIIFFFILVCIVLIWYFTRKEGLETQTDGSGCLVTDKSVDDEDISFNVSISCKEFKDVLMGSSLDEFSSLTT